MKNQINKKIIETFNIQLRKKIILKFLRPIKITGSEKIKKQFNFKDIPCKKIQSDEIEVI